MLCEGELQLHLYTNHIANAEGQVPTCSLCFIKYSVDVLSLLAVPGVCYLGTKDLWVGN